MAVGTIILYRTYAFFEEKKEFNVLKGQIPSHWYDANILSIKVGDEEVDRVPERGQYKVEADCGESNAEWDYNAWSLNLSNIKENTKCNITFIANGLTQAEYNQYLEAGVIMRKNTYRGKDISSYLTAEGEMNLYTQISSGRFNDIYVGDYIKKKITVNGEEKEYKWLIADLDNYMNSGNGENRITQHHVTIIPDSHLGAYVMNDTDTTEGGYMGSKMVTETLPMLLSTHIIPTFGSNHIIKYQNLLSTSIDATKTSANGFGANGRVKDLEWIERQLDLMSEANVYGTNRLSSNPYENGIDSQQYAIFRLNPTILYRRHTNFGLKNVTDMSGFVSVWEGAPKSNGASVTWLGVRPRFLIG